MNIYFCLGFIVLSFGIGFIMGGSTGWKAGYDFYDRNKDVINSDNENNSKIGLKYPNNFS